MEHALYGDGGFFVSSAPADHFRTSALASPLFARALVRLLEWLDGALGHPATLDIVDVGAGRGELLTALVREAPATLAARLRPYAVERAPRPPAWPYGWAPSPPSTVYGLLVATEWLDNVPVDIAQTDDSGEPRYVLVDPRTGAEALGGRVTGADAEWLASWWPLRGAPSGTRAEIGRPRDEAWAGVLSTVERGLALAVDYGHLPAERPAFGTLSGYRSGQAVLPVPDGSCDLTAHVAFGPLAGSLVTQRSALRALGLSGTRPPLALAHESPAQYVRALAAASAAAELTDPGGLGGHYWLLQPVGVGVPPPLTPAAPE